MYKIFPYIRQNIVHIPSNEVRQNVVSKEALIHPKKQDPSTFKADPIDRLNPPPTRAKVHLFIRASDTDFSHHMCHILVY